MNNLFIGGGILANFYHWVHPNVPEDRIPYWYKRSLIGEIWGHLKKRVDYA